MMVIIEFNDHRKLRGDKQHQSTPKTEMVKISSDGTSDCVF